MPCVCFGGCIFFSSIFLSEIFGCLIDPTWPETSNTLCYTRRYCLFDTKRQVFAGPVRILYPTSPLGRLLDELYVCPVVSLMGTAMEACPPGTETISRLVLALTKESTHQHTKTRPKNLTQRCADPRVQDRRAAAAGSNVPTRHRREAGALHRRRGALVQALGTHRGRAAEMGRPPSAGKRFAEVSEQTA